MNEAAAAISSLAALALGVGDGTASASPPAPDGLAPMLVRLRASARIHPRDVSLFARPESAPAAATSTTAQQADAQLSNIASGVQNVERTTMSDPLNALLNTVASELYAEG